MVANIRSGSSPGGALYYNKEKVDKDEAEVLLWQKMLEPYDKCGRLDIDACMESFMPYLEANRRTTNTVFHASLNPSPEDRLTDEQLRKIACEYMERMGYGEQPYIVFKHKDISREHLHIVSLRVDEQGRKLPHDFEARRSMEILRDLERKYGLHPSVKGQGLTDREGLRKVNYSEGNVKQQISSVARSCLRNYKCSSYGEFRTLLELLNVSVEERTGTVDGRDYAGVIYGAMTDDGYGIGTPFKSSRIGKDVGYKALQKYYERSKSALKQDGTLDRLRQTVKDAMSPDNTREEFRQLLKADGIDVVFRINSVGRIYGATFIDHNAGIVANGSLLGKEFSANAFNELYPAPKQAQQVAEQHTEQQHKQRSHAVNPLTGIVDTVLDLADTPSETKITTDYHLSLRANLLRWATLTPDLGVEWRICPSWGIAVNGSWTSWSWNDKDRRYALWEVAPEVRYYMGEKKAWYLGAMFKAGQFNYKLSETGKQGDLMGGGITAGYQLRLNKALALDFNLGLGYLNADFEKYEVIDGVRVRRGNETKDWCGPINAGVTLVWKLF